MGCAITGEKKVIPSIIGGKKKKQDVTSSDSNPLELPNPNGSVTELPIKRMSLTNDYIDPIIYQIGPKPEQKDRGPQPPFILKVKSPVETSPKSKQISPIPRDDPNCRGITTINAHLSEEMSFKRPVISTFHSMGRIASLTSVDLGDNSHAPKAHPIPVSMNNGGMPSALLTVDKGESLRSLPMLVGVEDRPSIEDIINKKDHGKCVSSLGLVEAVEEVSVSREININKHDDQGYLKPNQSDNNIEGKVQRARSHGESGVYGNLCILIPPERVIKNVSRHILHKDGGPSGARTPEDVEEVKEKKDVAEKIRSKNTLEPQIENSCFLKSPEGEKMKAQMKVKFTRNLVELVAKKGGADNKENLEPNKTPRVRNEPVPTDRENSLSLVYCPPDEMESNKPNLDMKILVDIFKGNEEISPIRRTTNRAFYEEVTPLASRENSGVKKKIVESSTLLEKTITNIEENLSESDIDKYSFVAEVREVEIDEKNDFNIYKGQNAQILPHPLVQKSACGNRHLVFARSSTLDPKTLSSTPTDVDKCANKEGKNENENENEQHQLVMDSGLESDKIC